MRTAILSCLILATAALAQPPRPAFEVVSLKPNPNCRVTGAGGPSPGRLELPCVTLRGLIRMAYAAFNGERLNARLADVTGGPGWLDSERYQLTAKAEGRASGASMMGPMLRTFLEERLQLKVHTEPRETPVFVLTVAKSGKLTPAKEGSCVPIDGDNLPRSDASGAMPRHCGGGRMTATSRGQVADVPGTTMEEFAGRWLSALVERTVIDNTGLEGRFDLHLEFTREYRQTAGTLLNGEPAPALAAPPADGFPTLFTALQEQLGLRLSPGRAPVDVIIVDSEVKPIPD